MTFFKHKQCLLPVSKNFKGELYVKEQLRQECEKPKCNTLKVQYELNLEFRSHKKCDEIPDLEGKLEARLNMATQGDGNGRGLHRGRFRWISSVGEIRGRMRGITNAGTHRLDNCENCDRRGHLEGQLFGKFVDGPYKGCRIRSAYVMEYDSGQSGQDTGVHGALEGVVVCPCKHE